MPDTPFACVICGTFIYDEDVVPHGYHDAVPWLNIFRGIYRDQGGIHLTGVSRNDENPGLGYTAPRDVHARWDDPEYDLQDDSVDFGAMTQRSVNGRYGSLFVKTNYSRLSFGLENLERIMGTIDDLVEILHLEQMPIAEPPRSMKSPENYTWEEISGHLMPTREEAEIANNNQAVVSDTIDFGSGCRPIYTASIDYPSNRSHIAFYFVSVGGAAFAPPPMFLCGLEIFTSDPNEGQFLLGYRSPLRRTHTLGPKTDVTGFTVAVGSRGISGIKVQTTEGLESPWYQGDDGDENPESMRAVGLSPICGIKASFDGFKIVALGIAQRRDPEPQPEKSLKESAIWYPEIAHYPVCLNEKVLPNRQLYSTGYFPLFWVSFGGVGGKDLELLNSIQITMVDGIWAMAFAYSDGREMETLGRHNYNMDLDPEALNIEAYEIDGSRGERISSISLWYDSDTFVPGQVNKPCGISIHTNWGISRLFGDGGIVPGYVTKHVKPEDGTVITGLYANQLPDSGFTAIGLMSERVESGQCSLESMERLRLE
ncbi:unnamed protein product [Clonostachys solani]|uniref:DUF7600 domain-containing protein n=1 Tax=Clonostachys solani TaxID=160281 RepID=A0A9N9YZJ4_9HYPO|nr:unnamed protein product [Clonostachys solani]